MKAKYLILFLILMSIFNLGLGCNSSESKEKSLTKEPKTINVEYVVLGFSINISIVNPEVSVTYNNRQGGVNQINYLELGGDPDSVFKNLASSFDLKDFKHRFVDFKSKECWRGEIIEKYNFLPEDEFLSISAQANTNCEAVFVAIIVNGDIWKGGGCIGQDCITSASGYYNK